MDKLLGAIGGTFEIQPTTTTSAPARAASLSGPTGATAQTGGFVGSDANVSAGSIPVSSAEFGAAGGLGGLQSSPNVPRPGTTINPATGLPHTAGLTRAELEAQRAAAGVGNGKGKERDITEVSGREQAARQLAGGAATVATAQAIRDPENRGLNNESASVAHTSTFSDEIRTGLKEVQDSIAPFIPNAIKGAFASPPGSPRTGTVGAPGVTATGEQRRGSLAALYNQVKTEGGKLVHNLQDRIDAIDPVSPTRGSTIPASTAGVHTGANTSVVGNAPVATSGATTTATSATLLTPATATTTSSAEGRRGSIADMLQSVQDRGEKLAQDLSAQLDMKKPGTLGSSVAHVGDNVKGFLNEIFESGQSVGEHQASVLTINDRQGGASSSAALTGATAAAMASGFAGVGQDSATLLATKHSLPATVPVAGSSGVSATGGRSLPSQENQGMLPGEVSLGAGALPGPKNEPGVALLPDEKKVEGTAGGLQTSTGLTGSTLPSTAATTTVGPASSSSSSYSNLAPALPATVLGAGAAKGATDLEAVKGVDATSAVPATPDFAAAGTGAVPQPPNGRTSSLASVTAIKAGHVGDRTESKGGLVGVATAGAAAAGAAGAAAVVGSERAKGPQSTVNGSHALPDSAPGAAHEGVGHPSAVGGAGTTRDVGSYPVADHAGDATHAVVPPTGSSASTGAVPASAGADSAAVTTTGPTSSVPGGGSTAAVPNGTATTGLPTGGEDGIGAEVPPSKNGESVVPPGMEAGRPAKLSEALHNPAKDHETGASAASAAGAAGGLTAATSAEEKKVTTAAPVSPTTSTKGPGGLGRASLDDKAHRRKSSGGGSEKKSGLFRKLKDKLTHHDDK